ncbi:CbrC family protein [Streptomyces sp. NPDC001581]|uniref:CbrC family protein n=1 Tax=Streptomyces sp. NPDC001581 TaxID=3154386 RepID=UPI003318FCC7
MLRYIAACGDGAAFLGPAGYRELEAHPEALAMLRKDHRHYEWAPPETEQFLRGLDRAGEPTAYLYFVFGARQGAFACRDRPGFGGWAGSKGRSDPVVPAERGDVGPPDSVGSYFLAFLAFLGMAAALTCYKKLANLPRETPS